MNPLLDPRKTPFSCRGSYLAVARYSDRPDGLPNIVLRTVSQLAHNDLLCHVVPLVDGAPAPFDIEMEPAELRLATLAGILRLCFADTETLLFRAASPRIGLRLDFTQHDFISSFGYDVPKNDRIARIFNCHSSACRMLLDLYAGTRTDDQDWNGKGTTHCSSDLFPAAGGLLYASLRHIPTEWDRALPNWDYEEAVALRRAEFRDFLSSLPSAPPCPGASSTSPSAAPPCPGASSPAPQCPGASSTSPSPAPQCPGATLSWGCASARELAAYVLWSCCVRPAGPLRREAMLMSKNWMTRVWSWDHAFNAIALAASHPDMAWNQFIIPFDSQDISGALPDAVSDAGPVFTFCKPPIHGWALARMMRHMSLTPDQLFDAYKKLSFQTNWWLDFRDRDQNGLCEYDHGNDSGWDNSTAFLLSPPVELPDLQAFLVLQTETLADLARRLGRNDEAETWSARSRTILSRLCEHCFDSDGHPIARKAFSDETATPDTLLLFLPVLLGDRLPVHIREYLVHELKSDRFLTEWGFATESPRSPHYTPDGYWLGPIWAPAMLLLIDGLRACGETDFARDVEDRFLRLFATSGSAENYNALTGQGLRDPAYTWAAAVFLTILGDRAS